MSKGVTIGLNGQMERNRKEESFCSIGRERKFFFSPRERGFSFFFKPAEEKTAVFRFTRSLARSVTMASKESRGRFTDARGESVFLATNWNFPSKIFFFFFRSFRRSFLLSKRFARRVLVLYTLFLEENVFPRRTKTRANEFYFVYIYLRGIYLIY